MDTDTRNNQSIGFMAGVATGACVGVGVAMWLAPRLTAELRDRLGRSTATLRERATSQYQQASTRVGEAVDDLAQKGQGVRNDIADAVASGARDVERFARAAKTP
jgi:gas vesicle protein